MFTKTNKLFTFLFISAIAVVFAGGVVWYVSLSREQDRPSVPDPETMIDVQVLSAGKNYTEQTNEDGTITRKITLNSTSYKSNDGNFLPINTSIVPMNKGDYGNDTNIFKTYLNADAASEKFISYQMPAGRSMDFTFTGASLSEWKVDENQAVYPSIYESVDVQYVVTSDSLIERFVILQQKESDQQIEQRVKLEGLYYKEHDDGSITFHDKKTKNIVLLLFPPVMYEQVDDSVLDQRPANLSSDLHYEVTQSDGGTVVIKRVIDEGGKEWLQTTAQYPVVIEAKYAGPLAFGESGQLWKFHDEQTSTEQYKLDSIARKFKIGRYQFPIRYNCNGCRESIDFRALLSFATRREDATINRNQINESSLVVYMHRSGASAVESELPEGGKIPVYIGNDIWDAFSDSRSVWQSMNDMVTAGSINVTGLPLDKPKTSDTCLTMPEECRREISIDASNINLSQPFSKTQFVFSGENIELETDGKFIGAYAVGLIPSLAPELQIIYTP